jgi:hypothetical protein
MKLDHFLHDLNPERWFRHADSYLGNALRVPVRVYREQSVDEVNRVWKQFFTWLKKSCMKFEFPSEIETTVSDGSSGPFA